MVILGHHCVAILLAKMLSWAPFLQWMCTFSFCINPWSPMFIPKRCIWGLVKHLRWEICWPLTNFMQLVSLYTPWNYLETSCFLMFSGVQKKTSGMKWVNGLTSNRTVDLTDIENEPWAFNIYFEHLLAGLYRNVLRTPSNTSERAFCKYS